MESQINKRIALLRNYMKTKNLQAFIIPSTDAHMSEYIPEYWETRKWISGFTGSAGTVVVTLDKAALWTDARYFIQAEEELSGCEIMLFKDRLPGTLSITDWLEETLEEGSRIGIDGNVYAAGAALAVKNKFKESKISLIPDFDPFDTIWQERPDLPKDLVKTHPIKYTGESTGKKIERVLAEAEKAGADAVWISTLDTIAWLFNMRGTDVPFNPVFISHAFISSKERILFVDTDKISPSVAGYLKEEKIEVFSYYKVFDFLKKICNLSICLDSRKLSYNIYNLILRRNWVIDTSSVADMLKSMKNEVELEGFRRAMIRDGVALTRFFMWLEDAIPAGAVNEYAIGVKLKEFRSEQDLFAGESFPAITGYAANGAIVHYHPGPNNSLEIKPEGLLLIDSGGQYSDGTTDITRTIATGELTEEMKKDYTLVLKGHIGLSKAVFPAGTRGSQIDVLARKAMWEQGINYLHGTGHGVGHFLNVHEGPQSIRQEENPTALCPGMVVSNEPGIYREQQYGIRIENMMFIKPAMTTSFGNFYDFEMLTLCPVDTTPIVKEMMTNEEVSWLNDYHKKVYEKLSPHLSGEEKEWLRNKTRAF